MQPNLNEHQRLKYLHAMGIPVWVRRLSRDGTVYESVDAEVGATSVDAKGTDASSVSTHIPPSVTLTESIQTTLQKSTQTTSEALPKTSPSESISTADLTDCSQMNWQALQTHISSCQDCGLHNSRSQPVFGHGDTSAQYIIIGDTPSADDDRRGHPFQGQAGKLLTNMLLAIDLPREAVYLANTIKCRPPNNRPPVEDELMHCQSALFRQIDLIKPAAILILGRVTAQSLLKKKAPLSTLRGKVHSLSVGVGVGENTEIPVVVTYHPKTLLKQTKDKRKAWEDLKLFKQIKTITDAANIKNRKKS